MKRLKTTINVGEIENIGYGGGAAKTVTIGNENNQCGGRNKGGARSSFKARHRRWRGMLAAVSAANAAPARGARAAAAWRKLRRRAGMALASAAAARGVCVSGVK